MASSGVNPPRELCGLKLRSTPDYIPAAKPQFFPRHLRDRNQCTLKHSSVPRRPGSSHGMTAVAFRFVIVWPTLAPQ